MRSRLARLALVVLALGAAACGSSGASGSSTSGSTASGGTLTVFGASSLTEAFTSLSHTFSQQHPGWKVALDFAGSDELAAQIEQGAHADVFAAASPKYPEQLQGESLLGQTTDFATNKLVLVVPSSNPAGIHSVADITKGAKLVVGDPAVPLGSYTEDVLGNLGIDEAKLHIVSKEQDAKSVLAKVTLGEADAGFVYVTDARSVGGKVTQFPLPASAQATAVYPIGVVNGSKNAEAARQWIDLVTGPTGQQVLKRLGFGPPPSG